ncbi:MAG: hypothetical protein KGH77_01940 [Candidatus Micrarchaeota archaeon]|nr:hypothetical protein [Candidatus Micrarchaeota archaeon]MDE1864170.1 hypothetical protein [Candidatus Micrarchaeota archaeon]
MTLVTALKCKDGIVMASDGQATGNSAGGAIRYEMPKIHKIGNALYGASGTIGMIQKSLDVVRSFSGELGSGITVDLRRSVRNALLDLSIEAQNTHRRYYGSTEGAPLADIFICAKDGSGEQRIWHRGKDGNDEYLDGIGYGCTGGGDVFGYTMLKGIGVGRFGIEGGKLIAYKVIRNAIEVGAYGLGNPIDMWSMDEKGMIRRESKQDLEVIHAAYLRMSEEEAKLIKQLSSVMRNKVKK